MGTSNYSNGIDKQGIESTRNRIQAAHCSVKPETSETAVVSANQLAKLATRFERLERQKAAVSHLMDQVLDLFGRAQLQERMLTEVEAAYYCGFRSADSQHRQFKRFVKKVGFNAKTDKKTRTKVYDVVDLIRVLTTDRLVLEN